MGVAWDCRATRLVAVGGGGWVPARLRSGLPSSGLEWRWVAEQWKVHAIAMEAERCVYACASHGKLVNYVASRWVQDGKWQLNTFLYDKRVPAAEAALVSRVLVGGQGLRGGDCHRDETVSVDNCCVFCLDNGQKKVESVWHVLFECEGYAALPSSRKC